MSARCRSVAASIAVLVLSVSGPLAGGSRLNIEIFPQALAQASPQESTEIQMLGAISGRGPQQNRSVALVKHRATGRIAAVPLGGQVFDVGELVNIQSKSIIIKASAGHQIVVYAKLGGARSPGWIPANQAPLPPGERYSEEGFERIGNNIRVDSAYRDRMVTKELPTILMSAASEPVVENGVIKGFRLFQFEPGSIFEKLGMHDGDIVSSINGVPLNDVARTIQFLNGLKAEREVELSVIRDGKPVKLNLNVN